MILGMDTSLGKEHLNITEFPVVWRKSCKDIEIDLSCKQIQNVVILDTALRIPALLIYDNFQRQDLGQIL